MKNVVLVLGAIIFAIFILSGCGQNASKQKELDLKERELALKEKELALKEKEYSHLETPISNSDIKNKTINIEKTQKLKSQNQPANLSKASYKVILKNVVTDENDNKHGDIYFNINGVEYLAQKEEWIRNWKEFQNKGNKLVGCSIGKKQTMDGYGEYWVEKSVGYLLIKSSYVGGNAQIENEDLIKKIKI